MWCSSLFYRAPWYIGSINIKKIELFSLNDKLLSSPQIQLHNNFAEKKPVLEKGNDRKSKNDIQGWFLFDKQQNSFIGLRL